MARAREIVEGYDGGVTLRQVMYRLVSEGVLPHTPSMYRHLSSHLAKARREERFPDLIDTLREVHVPSAWPDATAFLREAVGWFGLDRTEGQRPVYVAAEKDTLRQMFTAWLAEFGIPVLVVRGFASQSYADVVRRRTDRQGSATLLWFGDFDASGAEIERDWVRRTADCWSEVRRVLLTHDQVQRYGLPPAEGKHGDPRWPAFARRHGFDPARPVQWEVEALEPAELHRLVLAAVDPYIDRAVLDRQVAREEEQRRALAAFLDGWGAAGGGAPRS
ncbi:hypothetical protein AB0G74_30035 [Streptomyces sp. NPDC020875]|uniref:hypothetical protein n=1 Tax=Streptomyces sp. NPDC020875 TaxID=3154898 RepID=UPI0033C76FF0